MKLGRLFKEKACVFALEVFPPKKESGIETLYRNLEKMAQVPLDYISVTYSAGGGGAKKYTAQIAAHLKQKMGIEPLAHLTCAALAKADVDHELEALTAAGVSNVLALRGDLLPGSDHHPDFTHASDLAAYVQSKGNFYITGACYPEGHPESANVAADIEMLKLKLDAGVGHLVSQLFFDNGKFFRFLNLLRKKGVHCPVEAGVMPIVKKEQIERTVSLSSASLPSAFTKMVSRYASDPESFYKAGIEYAVTQIRDLIESGVDGVHLYAMNNAQVAVEIRQAVADLL